MPPQTDRATRPKLTSRGVATRSRIVLAAAELMHVQGVAATTIDDVLAASATSKSQFYQHFDDKSELVYEVITLRADEMLSWQRLRLEKVDSFRGLHHVARRHGATVRVAARAVGLRTGFSGRRIVRYRRQSQGVAVRALHRMADLLGAALERMRDNGALVADVDVKSLATGLLAAVEGGYLLSQTGRDPRLMQSALNMAIGHVASFATAGTAVR